MMPYGQAGFYRDHPAYFGGPVPGMMPPHYWPPYPPVSTPPQPEPKSPPPATPAPEPAPAPPPPPPPPVDTAKDEQIARLEKLILDDRNEREAKETAKRQAIERAAAEKAAQEAQTAHDRKITQEAAALARADAEKKAAEDAAKAKEEAEKAAASAASEAAAAAIAAANEAAAKAAEPPPPPPPPEKKKPIKFKDAVGRKFSFPFELCATWQVSFPFALVFFIDFVFFANWDHREWKSSSDKPFCTLRSLDLMWPRVTMIWWAQTGISSCHRYGKR
jgi:hypothetical protein